MPDVMQKSFNSGEWAPQLYSRVDMEKYRSGAALLQNFFVDYRGGASTRTGTQYIATAGVSAHPVRLIPFKASTDVSYILEFGEGYIRFFYNKAPVMSGGVPYTIGSPYSGAELAQINFAQEVNAMVLCHPNHAPYVLTLLAYNNWTLGPISFGTIAGQPGFTSASTTLSGGTTNYSYLVTSIAANGDESIASGPASFLSKQDLRTTYGSNSLTVGTVAGAVSYNWYKSDVSYFGVVPNGVSYGYIGNTTGLTVVDSNISPNFSITPPIGQNPFQGYSIISIVGSGGAYTVAPSISFSGGSPIANAVAIAVLSVSSATLGSPGGNYVTGNIVYLPNGVTLIIDSTIAGGGIGTFHVVNSGAVYYPGTAPTNPITQIGTSGVGLDATFNLTWTLGQIQLYYGGIYGSTPSVVISGSGGCSATAIMTTNLINNPTVPGFFQQRLMLAGGSQSPGALTFSQPGSYYNFNISNPVQADDSITEALASGQLETIVAAVPIAPGLILFTDQSSWMINGGGVGTAISPSGIVANRQSFNGSAPNIQPIVSNFDVLYVNAKGCSVWDATYNYYAQVFTGQDISVISSHLFYGYKIVQWTWAQAPFKVVWAVRNDGVLLSLTYAKEEEFIAWSHHNTNGYFESVASIPEVAVDGTLVDAVYVVVQRTINGASVKYIERFADRQFNNQAKNAWCVDAGIQYSGSPATAFSGAQQLAGASVTGLADGVVIPPFTMPLSGSFTLSTPASLVTIGLAFTAQLQTLQIDTGEPTIQGKQKKISQVVVRVVDALGLQIGSTFSTLTNMKDLIIGNVGGMTNKVVTDLVTGDTVTIIDPMWSAQGQFCIQQSLPLPATITGVIPQLTVGT